MKTLYIPSTINIKELALKHNPPLNHDYSVYILSLINSIPEWNEQMLRRNNGYTIINSTILQSWVHDYRNYLKHFISEGIIETDHTYIVEEKSFGYRFTREHAISDLVPVEISKYTLCKRLHQRASTGDFKYPYLKKWFDTGSLEFDYTSAIEFLSMYRDVNLPKAKTEAEIRNIMNGYNLNVIASMRLNQREYWFRVDSTGRRLHTNLTNIKSELRNFITYQGQELVSIDIKNSQPYLSTGILKENYYSNTTNNTMQIPTNTTINSTVDNNIMLEESELSQCSRGIQPLDVANYIQQVKEGTLYEYYLDGLFLLLGKQYTRSRAKELFLTCLYSDDHLASFKEKDVFMLLFPSVYKVFKAIKGDDYSQLAIQLQRLESSLILDVIAKRISREKRSMPLFTIHDSIVCPIGKEEYVKAVMTEELHKALKIEPRVAFNYWRPEEAYETLSTPLPETITTTLSYNPYL